MANAISEENAVRAANEAFYQALSAGSIEGISAACAHDSDVTALHETSTEVAVGWQAVLDSWKAVPFESFAELSCVMTNPAIKVHGTIARVAGLERVRGKTRAAKASRSPRSARTFSRNAETGGSSCITMRARPPSSSQSKVLRRQRTVASSRSSRWRVCGARFHRILYGSQEQHENTSLVNARFGW